MLVQAASFVWIAVETEQGQPERVGPDFAELVAAEFEAALRRDPLSISSSTPRRNWRLASARLRDLPRRHRARPPGVEVPPGSAHGRDAPRARGRGGAPFGPPPGPERRPRWTPADAGPYGGDSRLGGGPASRPPMFGRRRLRARRCQGRARSPVVCVSPVVGVRAHHRGTRAHGSRSARRSC